MNKFQQAQQYLAERHLDGWLLYDFQGSNPLALRYLDIPESRSRRFFYWIPAHGEPVKIVHAIEAQILDHSPGEKKIYSSWQSLESDLKSTLKLAKKIAMEYSPRNAIPYVSRVDGGTVDLIRSFGIEVVSSADFLPHFTAVLTPDQGQSHLRACRALNEIVSEAWEFIKEGISLTEYDVQQHILANFRKKDLITNHPPIVGVNGNSANPHYATLKESARPIRKGDFILIDLWAKEKGKGAVYGDMTRVAVFSDRPTPRQQEIFQIVRKAQKSAVVLVKERFHQKKRLEGWEVDDAARNVIQSAGYGSFFIHRTGHSIEVDLHGSGCNMDNLEMHDTRPLLPSTCFSIEPGIYLPNEFGVRLEHDIYIHRDGAVEVTGGEQDSLVCLL